MSTSFDLPSPDHFTAGTVGPPGQRVFYLQARGDGVLVTLKCEKQQVGALAEYLAGILEDLPAIDPDAVPATNDLLEPLIAEWSIGSLAVAWDDSADRVVLVAEEMTADQATTTDDDTDSDDDEPATTGATARFRLSREQVAAFLATTETLMAGGRPPCPFCGGPLDPDGHVCPRSNGHRG